MGCGSCHGNASADPVCPRRRHMESFSQPPHCRDRFLSPPGPREDQGETNQPECWPEGRSEPRARYNYTSTTVPSVGCARQLRWCGSPALFGGRAYLEDHHWLSVLVRAQEPDFAVVQIRSRPTSSIKRLAIEHQARMYHS